ncbi:MAG TPA: trigger factor [Dehalococcoidia bacterium]|nr:trigger factor [Dehalococcoidia bacterium]
MKVTREKTENSQVFLTIEMELAEVEESLEKSYYRLVSKAKIPGFRKGKAPRAILERYIGKESLLEDALNHLLPEAYEKAIKEQEIEAIAQPQIEIAQTDPVVFKVTIPLKPTIKLGDYGSIRLTPEPVQITEDDINSAMEQLRHHYASWEPVERQVDLSDLVSLDVQSNIENEPFINQKGAQYQVLSDLPFPAPGFAEQLLGMKRDKEKEFKLQFPLDYPRRELAGKEASFQVRVTEIKQERPPELNDEFARQIDPDFESLDSLREQVTANLRLKAEEKAKMDFEEQVVEAVVDSAQLEFPPVLVEAQISRLVDERLKYWQRGTQGLEEYLRSINKTEEELREELHPLAVKRVTWSLVLEKVTEEKRIEINDSEIEAEIESLTKSAGESKDELEKLLNTPQSHESIKQQLLIRKTIQRLVEIAEGLENKEDVNVQ